MDSRGLRGLQVSIGTGWVAAVRMGYKILPRLASGIEVDSCVYTGNRVVV